MIFHGFWVSHCRIKETRQDIWKHAQKHSMQKRVQYRAVLRVVTRVHRIYLQNLYTSPRLISECARAVKIMCTSPTLSPRLNSQHMVRITPGEGTSTHFCSWHVLLLTHAGSCFTFLLFFINLGGKKTARLWRETDAGHIQRVVLTRLMGEI